MTEKDLAEIEARISGEDEPGDVEWCEIVKSLIAKVRRLQAAVDAEREICAGIADEYTARWQARGNPPHSAIADTIAAAIRKRERLQ